MDQTLKQPSASAIRLEDVHVTLPSRAGPVAILRGLDMNVAAGESIAVVGRSGSGKSTLLMIIAGLERATEGRVTVLGANFSALNEDDLARLRAANIGIVFQSFHLVPTMTALENVAVPLELLGRNGAFDTAKIALEAAGLGHRMGHYPGQLSGGEQQRVALARAIVHEPKVIFADEPTGNLDRATGAGIVELLFALRARAGATLFLVTHEEGLAQRCDRILHMKDGVIAAEERAA